MTRRERYFMQEITPNYIKEASKKYKDKFDLIQVRFPKGMKEEIKNTGINQNEYIVNAVKMALKGEFEPVKQEVKEERTELPETARKADKTLIQPPEKKQSKQADKLPELPPIQRQPEKTEEELLQEDMEYINSHKPWEPPIRDLSVSRMLKERWKKKQNEEQNSPI